MDGELDRQDASNIIEVLRKNDEWQEEWRTYHLIGDALRQSSRLSMNISSSVNQKLKTEPTILFPNTSNIPRQQKYKIFAFSIAASVMAMISAWLIIHNSSYNLPQTITAENSGQDSDLAVPVMAPSPGGYPSAEINDYLFVHREFSPGTNMRGQVTNVHSSTEYQERYGR